MNKYKIVFLSLASFFCLANKPVMAITLPCESKLAQAAIPQSAYYLSEDNASSLQSALNTYNIVRLKPGGNYTKSLPIQLTSNQELYGLAGTKLPQVTIPQGTNNAILSGVSPAKILFTPILNSITSTQNNCLSRISGSIIIQDVPLTNNLFTDLNSTVNIDNSKKGYLLGNRFIRTMVHSSYPAIKIMGDSAKQSQNNLFVWTNILTPWGDGIIINNQKNISFIGIDAESWNWGNLAQYPGMMNVSNTDFLSVFMSNGGDNNHKTGQYFNLDAKNIILQNMNISSTLNPGLILGNAVQNIVTVSTKDIGLTQSNASTQLIEIFKNLIPSLAVNNQVLLPQAPPSNITDLLPPTNLTINPQNGTVPVRSLLLPATMNSITNILQSEHDTYTLLDKPVFNPIPDPAGANWQVNLSSQPDSADAIQALINQNGIAQLNPGIYYISKPLLLKNGQGIIGAGDNKTAIIAKSPTIDLIAGNTHYDTTVLSTTFILADLTLQGGLNGINHSAAGSGQGAQYNRITLSHVTFRNMTNAGILLDSIYAWDNNYIDNTNFFRCTTGIKQRPNPTYTGGDQPGMAYMDKNAFYQNQFIENGIAIDWQAKRGNNLNAFINSLFKNNQQALNLNNSDSTFFANSVFESTSTQPLILTNRLTGFVHSYFVSTAPATALFNNNVYCNDCNFNNSAVNAGLIVAPTGKNSYFINSTLTNPTTQPLDTGLIMNSNFTDNGNNPVINSLFKDKTAYPF